MRKRLARANEQGRGLLVRRVAWALVCLSTLVGAPLRADDTGDQGDYGRHQFEDYERDHWSFLPVVSPEVPEVVDPAWSENPIDRFWKSRWDEEGIEPAPAAEPAVLMRRLYFDLIGLPPTPAEQDRFLADPSPAAYERLVDELLARPEFGERWGRHWLDVVRYAESNGYERDGAKPHAWRYRDYVLQAVAQDKPFDRFLIEQVAGDELPDSTAETQIATTFLRLGPWDDEPADPEIDRYDQLDDVLGTTISTFQGLTIRCARCHDHKYEPFTQRDYARVLAAFEPLERPQNGRTDLDLLVGTETELAEYSAALGQAEAEVRRRAQALDQCRATALEELSAAGKTKLPVELIAALRTTVDERSAEQKKLVSEQASKLDAEMKDQGGPEMATQLADARAALEAAEKLRPAEPPRAYIWRETSGDLPVTHVLHRGDPRAPQEAIEPGFPAVLVDRPPPAPERRGKTSGRRLQLAQWMASPENPLTARVYVNRLWQHHFGNGLVATENDFGLMGEPPAHAALLDWLAAELVRQGWRSKPLHRLIVLSQTYRRASASTATGAERDPDDLLVWRWRPRRLEAEAIRDAVLATSGQLNSGRGGPSVFPTIADEVLAGQSRPGDGWKKDESPAEATRRSVYVFVKRTLPLPELEVMDFPCPDQSCEQRQVSTVAPQALTYWNGRFLNDQAVAMAERLSREAGDEAAEQIRLAYRLAYARLPGADELQLAEAFLKAQAELITADRAAQPPAEKAFAAPAPTHPQRRALEALCLVLLNSNEFVYVE